MVNIVDIPILKKRLVILVIGIIIGFLLISFINNNYPSFLKCDTTEKFTPDYENNYAPLNNNYNIQVPSRGSVVPNIPILSTISNPEVVTASNCGCNNSSLCQQPMQIPQMNNPPLCQQPMQNPPYQQPMQNPPSQQPMQNPPVIIPQSPSGFTEDDSYAFVPHSTQNPVVPSQPNGIIQQESTIPVPSNIDDTYASVAPFEAPQAAPRVAQLAAQAASPVAQAASPVAQAAPRVAQAASPVAQAAQLASDAPIKMYNFNTTWCGWSKKFQPEWDAFMTSVKSNSNLNNIVDVKDIKCDNDDNQQLCIDNNVEGFPTVVINANGNSSHYDGPRNADALMATLTKLLNNV